MVNKEEKRDHLQGLAWKALMHWIDKEHPELGTLKSMRKGAEMIQEEPEKVITIWAETQPELAERIEELGGLK